MPFEELDNKAREAASQFHPPYNEHAWGKMNHLLDRHLPLNDQPKKRRGLLWLLPAALLLGGGAWLLTAKPWKKTPTEAPITAVTPLQPEPAAGTSPAAVPAPASADATPAGTATGPENSRSAGANTAGNPVANNEPAAAALPANTPDNNNTSSASFSQQGENITKTRTGIRNKGAARIRVFTDGRKNNERRATASKEIMDSPKDQPATENTAGNTLSSRNENKQPPLEKTTEVTEDNKQPVINTPVENNTVAPVDNGENKAPQKNAAAKTKNKLAGKFSINISAGPDVSQVSPGRLGNFRTMFGAGLGFNLSPRLLLRTGVYAANKVYGANTEDYKPGINLNYPGYELTDINATCRVIQAPVTLSYIFPAGKKNNLLFTGGVNSVWMKREVYIYDYKSSYGGYTRSHTYEYRNNSKHLFSSLSLSAGFERQAGRLSLLAEPYISLPLSGIGFGNVKLKSAGILFTVSARPFQKK
jgi:hypothetical protein